MKQNYVTLTLCVYFLTCDAIIIFAFSDRTSFVSICQKHIKRFTCYVYSFLPFVALVTWHARPSVGLRNEKGHDMHLTLKRIFRIQTVVGQASALRRGWPLGLKTRKQLNVTGKLAVKEMWKSVCVSRRPKIVRLVSYWDTVYLLLQVSK